MTVKNPAMSSMGPSISLICSRTAASPAPPTGSPVCMGACVGACWWVLVGVSSRGRANVRVVCEAVSKQVLLPYRPLTEYPEEGADQARCREHEEHEQLRL
jgi:hypothetical protein